jgi:von Willebrand factor type A domain
VYGGPGGGKSDGYDLFKMKPTECTGVPTKSPTASPTDTTQPSSSPSMAPTVCADSYLNTEALNIALVVDLSFSTYDTLFAGSWIGDVNGDGKKNTILDAEVKAVDELLKAIAEEGALTNANSEIGLISFHTGAKFEGKFGTVGSEANRLMNHLKTNCRTETDESHIMHTNNGFTNFDAALDEAVEYFTNMATPNRLNLLVFLSDGIPNVRGDGDNEG